MFKVLDVREYDSIIKGSFNNGYCGGSLNIQTRHYFSVICENLETKKRERYSFFEGYKTRIMDKDEYIGYTGEFNILVPGDIFEIKETYNYKKVVIVKS